MGESLHPAKGLPQVLQGQTNSIKVKQPSSKGLGKVTSKHCSRTPICNDKPCGRDANHHGLTEGPPASANHPASTHLTTLNKHRPSETEDVSHGIPRKHEAMSSRQDAVSRSQPVLTITFAFVRPVLTLFHLYAVVPILTNIGYPQTLAPSCGDTATAQRYSQQ